MRVIIGITGASGVIYARALLKYLANKTNVETHLIISQNGKKIMEIEGFSPNTFIEFADETYDNSNLAAPPASGTFQWNSMLIIPCSMKSVSAISGGLELNLILRAAQVTLKERRQLILAPRETPLNSIHLKNMFTLSNTGTIIFPLCPGFYHNPESISDLTDFIVGKLLNSLNITQDLLPEWKGNEY